MHVSGGTGPKIDITGDILSHHVLERTVCYLIYKRSEFSEQQIVNTIRDNILKSTKSFLT